MRSWGTLRAVSEEAILVGIGMRRIFGQLVLPSNAPSVCVGSALVELRDVSRADAPSKVLANQRQAGISIHPGARIPFEFMAPEGAAGCALDLRAHIDVTGDGVVAAGDLLSTTSNPVSATDDHGPAQVLVQLI